MKRRALLSVTDKTGLVEFGKGLVARGFGLLSTGGTCKVLRDAGLPVQEVAEYTGFPEMMGGRIKTLHPRVHGGILARREDRGDREAMDQHGIEAIDLVCVNLYRFRETTRKSGATSEEIVENIDIGGPAMLRSAAKNHRHVAVVVDPADYPRVLAGLAEDVPDQALLRELAGKAFAHTAAYDAAIATWFAGMQQQRFPAQHFVVGEKVQELRYGENPHQKAAFYRMPEAPTPSLANSRQLLGKELSFNNILDLDAALRLVLEFEQPACVIVKHNNPCGTASAETLPLAFAAALRGDPLSAFGGIVAFNLPLDAQTSRCMVEQGTFVEAIVAPEVSAEAITALQQAKWGQNVRVLTLAGRPRQFSPLEMRQVSGGFLLQEPDGPEGQDVPTKIVTKRAPSPDELKALFFAWKVTKHVKSNAIVFARALPTGGHELVGVGAGQMSRVDSVHLATRKAGDKARGAVCGSDAFFPFADGLEAAARAGVTAVIQPGGSKRDPEVIAAADANGLAMVFTDVRHFRH